jgi:hypothetical protein
MPNASPTLANLYSLPGFKVGKVSYKTPIEALVNEQFGVPGGCQVPATTTAGDSSIVPGNAVGCYMITSGTTVVRDPAPEGGRARPALADRDRHAVTVVPSPPLAGVPTIRACRSG